MHEWSELEIGLGAGSIRDLTTWLFEDDSFAPAAKLTAQGAQSVVCDHTGTPISMYDEKGMPTWEMALDSYGGVRQGKGKPQDCPFRYQDQYEDIETGLYYNRFRYYDPENGRYISQDPIGPVGGWSMYSYVTDPNIFIDPFGLSQTPISLDHALQRGVDFMQPGVPQRMIVQPSSIQFIQQYSDASGNMITKRVGIDINPGSAHVQEFGPHLNLQTQINGKIQKGLLADPHTPIDPLTIKPGDICP